MTTNPIGPMYGIFTYTFYIFLIFMVSKYTSPMDPMGINQNPWQSEPILPFDKSLTPQIQLIKFCESPMAQFPCSGLHQPLCQLAVFLNYRDESILILSHCNEYMKYVQRTMFFWC